VVGFMHLGFEGVDLGVEFFCFLGGWGSGQEGAEGFV
jgi:hypothetical protein